MAHTTTRLKTIGGDTPLRYLLQQGVFWEQLRSDYWTRQGHLDKAMDATAQAERHQKALDAMVEASHRYTAPQVKARFS
jgi:hypothetical protein